MGRIVLKWLFKKWDWGMDLSDVAEHMDKWQAVLNTVLDCQVL